MSLPHSPAPSQTPARKRYHTTLRISARTSQILRALTIMSIFAALADAQVSSPALAEHYEWNPGNAPKGRHAPTLVPFRDGHALRFSSTGKTRVHLGQGEGENLRTTGALTLFAAVQLAASPRTKTPFISKWRCREDGRSYELGVQPDRTVFFAISESGIYDTKARELFTDVRLKVGFSYLVVGVFAPGKHMSVFINGVPSGDLKSRIPGAIFDSQTPVLIGNRPGAERRAGFNGLIADVGICSTALSTEDAVALSNKLELTDSPESEFDDTRELPPCRAITKGPKHHWFGYYDKLQFDPTCRYVLSMQVDFEGRSPRPDDEIKVGMIDLQDNDTWIELGTTQAWCWQQGCMLQWRPGSQSEVLWNDRQNDRFVCHIMDVKTRERRTLPHPVYTVSPDGKTGCAPDFRRVQDMRPGYGYCGLPDPNADILAPDDSGIVRVDLETGESTLIVSVADVAAIPHEHGDISAMKHYFNHLLINTDGTRLEFLNRWRGQEQRSFGTRMLTCNLDGSDIFVLDPHGRTSHFIWRDPSHILAWSWHPDLGNGFILYRDKTREVEIVGKETMSRNGHNTYLPNPDWILNDTYPDNQGYQHPYLYHVPTGERFWLGHFRTPSGYGGEWRCDLHPRFSPDGNMVVIDSAHGGNGRQMHLIDISTIVTNPPQ